MPEIGEYRITVQHCDREESPREFGGNLGVLVLHHRDYVLPAEGDLAATIRERLTGDNVEAVLRWLRVFHGATVALPVIGYSYGDQFEIETVKTWSAADRPRLIGVVYDTPETRANRSDADAPDWPGIAYAALVAEVHEFDRWTNDDLHMYVIELYDGDRWSRVADEGTYYDADVARTEGEDALAGIRASSAAAGDPAGIREAARVAMTRLREDSERLASRVTQVEADIAKYQRMLAANDPDHPLYVAPGAAWHCHVQAHNEADTETFPTLFAALAYAADHLERLAEHEHDGMVGAMDALKDSPANVSTVEAWRETAASHGRAQQYANLAANARTVVEQAGIPLWRRASAYNGPSERASRDQLMLAANWAMNNINDGSPVGVWDCVDADCELKNTEDSSE